APTLPCHQGSGSSTHIKGTGQIHVYRTLPGRVLRFDNRSAGPGNSCAVDQYMQVTQFIKKTLDGCRVTDIYNVIGRAVAINANDFIAFSCKAVRDRLPYTVRCAG